MNQTAFRIKQYFLSTAVGQAVKDAVHKRSYTLERAKKASIRYYGDDRYAEDMLNEAKKYKVTFWEYGMYHFESIDFDTRRTYIPVREAWYNRKLNPYKASRLFDSKGDIYKKFKQYYQRDVIELRKFNNAEKTLLKEMAARHGRLFLKPVNGFGGLGVAVVDFNEKSFESAWNEIRKNYKDGCLAEEPVRQRADMSQIVPGVVNTLRVSTVAMNDRVEILGTCWRCGRQGRIVDNGASGGLVCGLDTDGKVVAAVTEDGVEHTAHSDTGKKIIGFQIPDYHKALELAKELACICPKVRYVGWDFALTDNGWIMIEGNSDASFGAWQIPLHKGTRPMLDPLMKELNFRIPKLF